MKEANLSLYTLSFSEGYTKITQLFVGKESNWIEDALNRFLRNHDKIFVDCCVTTRMI